jgi:dTDP-4-dehydrorhamnose 3,5-epimerase
MPFRVESEHLGAVKVIVPEAFHDERGFFYEVYRHDQFAALGLPTTFVQLNQSGSVRGVVRGLHFQWEPPMGKLMRVTRGRAFLVAVDIRHNSPTCGHWFGIEASDEDRRQLWAPASFARGFCVLSDFAEVQYLCTGNYNARAESGIRWDDPEIGIAWPVREPILSDKDRSAQTLAAWLARPESHHFALSDTG